ncbi:hypothetical protein AB0F68_05555 [Micromonospora sp. NPDC023966]|uniref:hypothetical protein n=1 Tax=Micromonospora sp. NPDC023966 TaxID=3154699 RepID=UPI00340A5028
MSATGPTPPHEDPVRRDDELLDALRRGAPPADDPVAALLGGWQAEVEARAVELEARPWPPLDGRPADAPGAARDLDPAGPVPVRAVPPAEKLDRPVDPTGTPEHGEPAGTAPKRRRPGGRIPRRRVRVLSGAALTLVTLAGGLGFGSARAEPGGLLWPVTQLVWTERADTLVAEREIDRMLDQARRDLRAGRYAEARTDLERAAALLTRLGDGPGATRIRDDLAKLWQRLPAPGVAPVPSPAPPATPGATPIAPERTDDVSTTPATVLPADGDPAPDPGHDRTPGRPPATTSPATAPATTAPLTGTGRDRHTTPDRPTPRTGRHTAPDRPATGAGAGRRGSAAGTPPATAARPRPAPGEAPSRGRSADPPAARGSVPAVEPHAARPAAPEQPGTGSHPGDRGRPAGSLPR